MKQNKCQLMKFIGIIPARYASSRFPGKPLADICGKSMIERVYRRASEELDEVYVATDDERISDAVKAFEGNVVMTSTEHRSGTDRCYEAYRNIGSDADVVINIQGDEPFIDPSQIASLKRCFDDASTCLATLVRKFDPARGFEAVFDPNVVKVTFDSNYNALYFSRSIIPYVRNYEWKEWVDRATFYTHVGMYAYRIDTLAEITSLPQSSLELAESLEQLRWIQNGYKIKVGITGCPTIGIDTPADLEEAIKLCKTIEQQ
jgi:3-deoxy-manno-octulosonate cytidylyltransferase (CMP-KDO synthetase)